jgi:outer membrane immunogenic protein
MRRTSALSVAMLLLAGPAVAADLTVQAPVYKALPPAPVYNWSGFYVGGNVGGAWGNSDAGTTTVIPSFGFGYFASSSPAAIAAVGAQHINSSGVTGGAQAGYNWQFGSFVLGVEADINSLSLKGSTSGTGTYPCCAPTSFTVNSAVSTDWLFTARPRVGYAVNNWLFYGTGGLAVGNVNGSFNFTDTFAAATESGAISTTRTGWAAGGGVEVGVQGPWTVKVEYLHVDLGSASTTSTNLNTVGFGAFPQNPFTHTIDLTADIVRAGVNYRF